MYLLFFDTFSHEVNNAAKLDLVQFPKAVQVTEVRVIPLGARVQADFPGGVRLGATNPSQFAIDFFVNDLGKRGAATFENVGQLQYNQQGPIKLDFEKTPPTDGLLLRGAYNTITLAVYGTISKINRDNTPPPPPAPMSPSLQSAVQSSKRDTSVVVNPPPTLPHPLPEKVNPNERIRDWLQDTQIPLSPRDLDASPAKAWDDAPYDSDAAVQGLLLGGKDGLSPHSHSRDISMVRSPPRSPPPSPPPRSPPASPRSPPPAHSQPPSQLPRRPQGHHQSREQSHDSRDRRSREVSRDRQQRGDRHLDRTQDKSHDLQHERSIERSHDRQHDRQHERQHERSHDRPHERSIERSRDLQHERSHERSRDKSDYEGDRTKSSREKSQHRSREKSREQSENRSTTSLTRSQPTETWGEGIEYPPKDAPDYPPAGGASSSGREGKKRSRESRRSREEKRDKCRSHEEWEEGGGASGDAPPRRSRGHRSYSSDSAHEGGPRTPPLPPAHWRDDADQPQPANSNSKRRRLERREHRSNVSNTTNAKSNNNINPDGVESPAGGPEKETNEDVSSPCLATVTTAAGGATDPSVGGGGDGLLLEDAMEAISDDEDLPDLPPEGEDEADAMDTRLPNVPEKPSVGASAVPNSSAAANEFEFEEIMSDEEEFEEEEFGEEVVEEFIVEEWEDWTKPNALLQEFQCVPPLLHLSSPSLTKHQQIVCSSVIDQENFSKLTNALESLPVLPTESSSEEDRELFVQKCEQVAALLPDCQLPIGDPHKLKDTVNTLCQWVQVGLNMDQAMAQAQPVYKIRHLKAGLRLSICLCQCNDDVTVCLLSQLPLFNMLNDLYHVQHMALSIKLLILRCMDAVLNCRAGIEHFLMVQPKLNQTGYEITLHLLASTSHTRAKVCAAAILRKLHLLEVMEKLRDDVINLESLLPSDVSPSLQTPTDAVGAKKSSKTELSEGLIYDEKNGGKEHNAIYPVDTDKQGMERDETELIGETPEDGSSRILVPRELMTSITSCLKHVLHTFTYAEQLLSQPHRSLPVGKQFQVPRCPYDILQEVFVLLDHGELLTSIGHLYSAISLGLDIPPLNNDVPCTGSSPSSEEPLSVVRGLALQLVQVIVSSPRGLTHLAAQHLHTTALLRCLLKGNVVEVHERSSCQDLFSDTANFDDFISVTDVGLRVFGAQLLERLHVLHQIDNLMLICNNPEGTSGSNIDNEVNGVNTPVNNNTGGGNACNIDLQQSVVHLNSLAAMLMTPPSKVSLARVLATGDYIKALYPYLMLLQPEDSVESAPLKIACYGYAVEMVVAAVKLDGNVHFLEENAEKLCQIIELEEARDGPDIEETAKLSELLPWLAVARKPESFSYDFIPQLVDIVKDQLEHVDKFPGELFTALRLMKSLAIPPHQTSSDGGTSSSSVSSNVPVVADDGNSQTSTSAAASDDVIQELKYKYAVVQMFYADLTTHLNTLLTKACSLLPQPGLHAPHLAGLHGGHIVNLLQPALDLLYCLLRQVIQARGAAYHDLSSMQPLLSTYLLVSSYPSDSPHRAAAAALRHKVLSALLLYTQPGHSPDTPCNANSLWSQMIAHILKFIESAPHTMVSGLCLLTELLPLPLPVMGRRLSAAEQERCIVVRNLWAANLAPLSELLYRLLHHLSIASQPSLTHGLRRVCVAIADLAPQLVVVILRPLLDLAVQHQKTDCNSVANSSTTCNPTEAKSSVTTAATTTNGLSRVLFMLASLSSHAGCKAAMLHLLTTESYSQLLPNWCSSVATQDKVNSGDNAAIVLKPHSAPLCLLFNNLCNININLQGTLNAGLWGVPGRELLPAILECLLTLLSCSGLHHRLLSPAMAALCDLITHDYGVYHLKCALDKKKCSLHTVLLRLISDLRDPKIAEEAVCNLQSVLEICYGLLSCDSVPKLVANFGSSSSTSTGNSSNIATSDNNSTAESSSVTKPTLLRTMSVTPIELCSYVGWLRPTITGSEMTDHSSETVSSNAPEENVNDLSDKDLTVIEDGSSSAAVIQSSTGVEVSSPNNADPSRKSEEAGNSSSRIQSKTPMIKDNSINASHPLRLLENIVVDISCPEAVVEQIYKDIGTLIAVLDNDGIGSNNIALVGKPLTAVSADSACSGLGGGSIKQQYDERLVSCSPTDSSESPEMWLKSPPPHFGGEDCASSTTTGVIGTVSPCPAMTAPDTNKSIEALLYDDSDRVSVSLLQILRDCGAGDFDLEASVQKVLRGHPAGASPQKPAPLTKGPAAKFKSNPQALRPSGRGMRPYGFANRGMNLRTDPFRCRPPNTSRPPSLHVDDFVALESTGHQPTGPTGYNRISFGRGKMLLDSMRGRGGRGMMNRGAGLEGGRGGGGPMGGGRFMYRPPMYRPDFGNRGMSRGMRWQFRGGDSMMRGGPPGQYRQQGGPGMRFQRGRGGNNNGGPGMFTGRGGMRGMRGNFH